MIYDCTSATQYLQEEFERRVRKNSRYSLRAFARSLNVNAAELSQVFRGSRRLSWKSAVTVSKAMGLTPAESKHLLNILQTEKGKKIGLDLVIDEQIELHSSPVNPADFEKLGDWYHFAILNLIDTKGFEWTATHIARRLGLSPSEARIAMETLERSGMVQVLVNQGRKQGKSVKAFWEVGSQMPSESIRRYHRQCLQKAIDALDTVPMDQREYRSVGIVVGAEDLGKIRAEVKHFTDLLMQRFERKGKNHVYQIQVAVFPLTKEST